ncbi:MAG: diacylglycerol kinase family lipid kinase [Bacteroidales bacterium]|nr:diacylglycerol kinase family lipid kinase [Bacteroidales bacterium]
MRDKILFIINPISGNRSKANIPDLIGKAFNHYDYCIKIITTQFAGEAPQIVRKYISEGFYKIIAVGGDGTINEIASELTDTDAALGIIPLGSGNGLARHLKIPLNIKKALDFIKIAQVKPIDYGKINNRKFFCTTGVGFDAHIGHVFSKLEGRGFINYIKATLSEFRQYKPQTYELICVGKTITRNAFLITIANASQYGNNAYIAPKANISDGKLEVSILKKFSILKAPEIGLRLFLKNIDKSSYVETFQCQNITVKRKNPDVIHFDGEPAEMGEMLNIEIVHKGLKVLTC